MKRNILRLLSLILALLAISATFFSCGNKDNEGGETSAVTGEQGEDEPVPHLDWGGRPFRVLATHNDYEPNFEIIGEAGADKLAQKIFERNVFIEEYYNVEILDVAGDDDTTFNYLEKDFMAGSKSYNLAFLIRDDMSSAIQRGFMKDITLVDYVNLENEWYNPVTIESMKISDRLYHLSSSFSLTDKARTATLFFNRDMATDLNLGIDVISEVRAGTWTIDKMYQMITQVAASGDDGDGVVQNSDTFGIVGGGTESATAIYAGLGNKLVNLDAGGEDYGAGIIEDRSLLGLDTIKAMFDVYNWAGFTGSEQTLWAKDYELPFETFVDERALFYAASMGSIEGLAEDATFAYTAITFPKYDTDQDRYYATNDNTYSSTFGIPYMAYDVNFSGFMIEVLSWKSHTTTYPEYYQIKCMVQKSYDPVCAEMLQLNYEGLVFDFGFMFSNTVTYKKALEKYTTSKSNTKNMATLYAEYKVASNNAVKGILETIEALPE